MRKFSISVLLFCNGLFAQDVSKDTVWLGDTAIEVSELRYGSNPLPVVFVHLHENETTSAEAAMEYLEDKQALFLRVQHLANRLISFGMDGTLIQFDPNRMFSKKGRAANLKLLNKAYPAAAEKLVGDFSQLITRRLAKAGVVIAVHNNTDGKPLTVKDFRQKYINPAMDPDDFILTTERKIFDRLKKKKINAVWQTTKTSADDGSLSIYCARKKIPYINIEVEEGQKDRQLLMLNAITDIIDQFTK